MQARHSGVHCVNHEPPLSAEEPNGLRVEREPLGSGPTSRALRAEPRPWPSVDTQNRPVVDT
jgi:hypothetical protein